MCKAAVITCTLNVRGNCDAAMDSMNSICRYILNLHTNKIVYKVTRRYKFLFHFLGCIT